MLCESLGPIMMQQCGGKGTCGHYGKPKHKEDEVATISYNIFATTGLSIILEILSE
jgi:hypothetical protein